MSKIGNTILAWGYKLLADRGNAEAQYTLGIMYYTGKKVIEDKKEAMAAALEENFKPPQEGSFDPDAFKRGIEAITSMLKPEGSNETI